MIVVMPEAFIPDEANDMRDIEPSEDDGDDFDL